ncbi:MAG: alpha/beta fold hydrolase [Promethearchaeota archaeon]
MTNEKFNLGEVQIEAIVNGIGELMILLSRGDGDASTFDSFTPLLNEKGYKTVAINRRGYAGSSGPLENLTLHDLANDVAGVIRLLGEGPVHILGWAFGNRIARCVAENHPQLVKSVILLAAGGKVAPNHESSKYYAILAKPGSSREERLEALRFLYFSPSTDIKIVAKAFKGGRISPEERQKHRKATEAHGKANLATPIMEWWNGGKAPMLVIQGLDDKTAVPENGLILKEENGDRVKLVNIEKAGHFLVNEKPERVVKEIVSFLKSFD